MTVIDKHFFDAIAYCETRGEKYPDHAIGKDGLSYGRYQITDVYREDVRRIRGVTYTREDCFDPAKSEEMMRVYLSFWVRRAEKEARRWLADWEVALIHHHGPNGWKRGPEDHYAKTFVEFNTKAIREEPASRM